MLDSGRLCELVLSLPLPAWLKGGARTPGQRDVREDRPAVQVAAPTCKASP